mgnify:CR=1 FL=1
MAFDNQSLSLSLAASTGLRPLRFVTLTTGSTSLLAYPTGTTGRPILGALDNAGTTRSGISAGFPISVQTGGVVKVEAESGTLRKGRWVASSSVGRARLAAGADARIGLCVGGSSGGANRVLSVQLIPYGSTKVTPP